MSLLPFAGPPLVTPVSPANGGTGTSTVFTKGSVVFAGTSGIYNQDNANLFWDDTNNRLGLGCSDPGDIFVVRTGSDRRLAFGDQIGVTGAATIQAYNDARNLNIPLEIRGTPIIMGVGLGSGGNVGIGTATPGTGLLYGSLATKLHVYDATLAISALQSSGAALFYAESASGNALIGLADTAASSNFRILDILSSGGKMTFRRLNDAYGAALANSLTIDYTVGDNTGYFGFGTATPTNYVDIYKSINNNLIARIKNDSSGSSAGTLIQLDNGTSVTSFVKLGPNYTTSGVLVANRGIIDFDGGTAGSAIGNSGNSPLIFYTNGYNNERMRISEGGNIGIGTSTFQASMVTGITLKNGTAPSGNATDQFAMYSSDQAAGNASPFFRTENGSIIKLFTSSAYTPTNVTTDRSYDANATTVDELADVLGTLIADLQATGLLG